MWTTCCLRVRLSVDIWVILSFYDAEYAAVNIGRLHLFESRFSLLLGVCLGVKLLVHMVILY